MELVTAQAPDREVTALYETHAPSLIRLAYVMLGDRPVRSSARRDDRGARIASDLPWDSAEAAALVSEEYRHLLRGIRALPPRQREALVLRYYLNLSGGGDRPVDGRPARHRQIRHFPRTRSIRSADAGVLMKKISADQVRAATRSAAAVITEDRVPPLRLDPAPGGRRPDLGHWSRPAWVGLLPPRRLAAPVSLPESDTLASRPGLQLAS